MSKRLNLWPVKGRRNSITIVMMLAIIAPLLIGYAQGPMSIAREEMTLQNITILDGPAHRRLELYSQDGEQVSLTSRVPWFLLPGDILLVERRQYIWGPDGFGIVEKRNR